MIIQTITSFILFIFLHKGVAITVTSFTDICAFLIGATTVSIFNRIYYCRERAPTRHGGFNCLVEVDQDCTAPHGISIFWNSVRYPFAMKALVQGRSGSSTCSKLILLQKFKCLTLFALLLNECFCTSFSDQPLFQPLDQPLEGWN